MTVIALTTFREMFRKKVFTLTLVLTAAYLLIYGTGTYYAFRGLPSGGPNDAFTRSMVSASLLSMGLFFASFMVAFLVVLSSVGTISGEIESGTMHSIVPKPIRRLDIVLGKFIGIGAMIVVYAFVLFISVAQLTTLGGPGLPIAPMLKASALFSLQPLILLSLTLLGSTLTSTMNNGVAVVMLYGLAMIGGFIEQIGVLLNRAALVNIGIITSLLIPVDAVYRRMIATLMAAAGGPGMGFGNPFGANSEPSLIMMAYAGFYLIAALLLAVRAFETRDI